MLVKEILVYFFPCYWIYAAGDQCTLQAFRIWVNESVPDHLYNKTIKEGPIKSANIAIFDSKTIISYDSFYHLDDTLSISL